MSYGASFMSATCSKTSDGPCRLNNKPIYMPHDDHTMIAYNNRLCSCFIVSYKLRNTESGSIPVYICKHIKVVYLSTHVNI